MTDFPISEIARHKKKDCKCILCVGVEKLGPDWDEAMPEVEKMDAQKQFQHDEKLLLLGDD